MTKCSNCGKDFTNTKENKAARKMISVLSVFIPDLHKAVKEAKDYCGDCYKAKIKPVAKEAYVELEKL